MELKIAQSSEKAKIFESVHPQWPHDSCVSTHVKMRLESAQHNHATWYYLEVNKEIAASLGAYPFKFNIQGRILDGIAIGAVFTIEKFRGRGLAKKLISMVEDHSLQNGAQLSLLYSDIGHEFYQQLGYEKVAIFHGTSTPKEEPEIKIQSLAKESFPTKVNNKFNAWIHRTDAHQYWLYKMYSDSICYRTSDSKSECHMMVGQYENETYILDWRGDDLDTFHKHSCHLAKHLNVPSLPYWTCDSHDLLEDKITIPKTELPMIHWLQENHTNIKWHLQPIDHV